MSHRVYLPLTVSGLRAARAAGGFGPPPLRAHAVTAGLREAVPDGDQDDWEYLALTAAARASVELLGEADPARRLVAALDVPEVAEDPGSDDVTRVVLRADVAWRHLASVHVDSAEAVPHVAAARGGEEQAWEDCDDHDLEWWAPQEVDVLLAGFDAG